MSNPLYPPKPCVQCGELFQSTQRKTRFCSRTCYAASRTLPSIPCAQCGKLFQPSQRTVRCCSFACGRANIRIHMPRVCTQCGKVYHSPTNRVSRFCSVACRAEARTRPYSAHPKSRGSRWPQISRDIRARDNHTCQHCNASSVRLHVHHIVPWGISHDSSPKNLVTLCTRCHGKAEAQYWREHPINQLRLPI